MDNKIKIVIGSHGAGKSNWIYNYFFSHAVNKEKGVSRLNLKKKLYLVVPEQDTNDKQRLLINEADKRGLGAGILNIDVVSFDRLAHMVFEILDIEPEEKNVIDDAAKTMMLSLTLSKLNKDNKIKYYDKMVNKIGFARKLTQVVSEFYSYNINKEKIEPILNEKKVNGMFKNKLSDLMLIYDEFTKDLKDKGFSIKEDKYDLLNKNIDKVDLFDDAIIAFDGFTGFTPVQMDIFKKLVNKASDVFVAVDLRCDIKDLETITANLDDESDVFLLSKKFINDLYKAASDLNMEIKKEDFVYCIEGLKEKYKKHEDLLEIEKHIYDYSNNIEPIDAKNIELYTAKNTDDEVANVVNIIKKLVTENQYRYNDIKILIPCIEDYSDRLLRAFNEADIPLFIDDSTGLLNSPYIETIRAAIDVVNYDFTYDSVMRYLNAGILEKGPAINRFDNFILSNGIRGYEIYKKGFEDFHNANAEKVRNNLLTSLIEFYEDISDKNTDVGHTAVEYVNAIREFIKKIKLDNSFAAFIKQFNEKMSGDNDYNRQYNVLNESFKVLNETLNNILLINKNDDNKIDINDFKKLLDIGFTDKSIKSIPYRVDQIVAGDIMRSRFDNPKVMIFIGMNQSKLPASQSDLSLIDDDVRKTFDSYDIKLSQTTVETTLNQRFYIYLALTNPCEKLILSYPRLNANNVTDEVSPVLNNIKNLYNNIKEIEVKIEDKIPGVYVDLDDSNISVNLIKNLDERYVPKKDKNKEDKTVKNKENEDTKKVIEYETKPHKSSVSSIEQYNSCPYRYFLNYSIGLSEREVHDITPADMGSYCHAVLEKIFSNNKKPFDKIDKKDVAKLVQNAMKELDTENDDNIYKFKIKDGTYGKNRLNFIKKRVENVLITTVGLLIDFQKNSVFNGKDNKIVTENEFDEKIGKQDFRGIIDRQDTVKAKIKTSAEDEAEVEKTFINIIDYKSSAKKITVEDIDKGIKLQLLVYLDHSRNAYDGNKDDLISCGAFYVIMKDPIIKIEDLKVLKDIDKYDIEAEKKKQTEYWGIFNTDPAAISAINDKFKQGIRNQKKYYSDDSGYKLHGVFLDNAELIKKIDDTKKSIINSIANIEKGIIKVKPYSESSCDYCPYSTICRKDQKDIVYGEDEDDDAATSDSASTKGNGE